jgi:L-seryl-tRNA(Ser) seleniumtransferase
VYLAKDHAREYREFEQRAEIIRAGAAAVPGISAEVFVPEVANHVPHVRISWPGAANGRTAAAVVHTLLEGEPSIAIRAEAETLVVGVWMMRPGEEKTVARRLREVLAQRT